MLVDIAWIRKNYAKYNDLYWGGILPDITFATSRSRKTWGYASYTYNLKANIMRPTSITISNYYDSPEEVKLTTLLHEMIHIADYTLNPEHFIRYGRKVRGYDAHGWWFKQEAARLAADGWDIEKYVTAEEKAVSSLSENAAKREKKNQERALIGVVVGNNGYNFMFKTSTKRVATAINTINTSCWDWYLGGVKDINFYSFNNPRIAAMRSCSTKIRGWRYNHHDLLAKLESYQATEVRIAA